MFAIFEAPLAAAAIAGGAVSIPIIIHLLNRRRFNVVTWAAMRFLLAAQRKNSRRMRLEQFLLLTLRCLILLLLVLAMASVTPWAEVIWRWFAPNAMAARLVGTQRAHKILVIDGSFSMATRGPEGSCFDRAKGMASKIVQDSPSGDGFSIVLLASPARRIVPGPSEDARKVLAEIEALRLPHGNGDLVGTLNSVEALAAASPDKFPLKEIYILTDLQQSTWVLPQPGLAAAALQKLQGRAHTVLVDVGGEAPTNIAVTSISLGEDLATTGRVTSILATLQNYGPETRDAVTVRLLVGKARARANEPPCIPRVIHETIMRVERGQQTPVAFPCKFPSPGEYLVTVQIESDALDLDDSRSAVVTVKKEVPILLVNGKPFGDPFDQATEWLRLALNPFDGSLVPGSVVARPRVLNPSQFADEGQGDLSPYDCVFLCDVPAVSLAEARRLEGHVRRGGGLVICLGDQVQAGEYNRVLYRGGNGLLPAPLVARQSATEIFSYQLAIEEGADRTAPLKAFRAVNDRTALQAARFRRFYQLGEPGGPFKPHRLLSYVPIAVPGREPKPTDSKAPPPGGIALLDWNPPLEEADRFEREEGEVSRVNSRPGRLPARGRVLLLNASANSDWSNWPASPSYPPMMQELMQFAAAGRLREQALVVGEPLEIFVASNGQEGSVLLPDGRAETVRAHGVDESLALRWLDTDLSGLYRASVGQHPREHLVAINVPIVNDYHQGSESNLTRTNLEELQRTYPEWEIQVVTELGQIVHAIPNAASLPEMIPAPLGSMVARWLLLSLLILTMTEFVLAWVFAHHADRTGASPPAERLFAASIGRLARFGQGAVAILPWVLFVTTLLLAGVLIHDGLTGDFLGFLPEGPRRGIEQVLGIAPPAPGEGSRWRLEFSSYLISPVSDPWVVAAMALVGAALIFVVYRQDAMALPRLGRFVLTGLRIGLVLVVLIVLLPQPRVWFERQGFPEVVLLIDDSQSMSATDRYRDPRVQEVANTLAEVAGLTVADRLHLAQAILTRSDADWLTALLAKRKVRIHVYRCSTRAQKISDLTTTQDVAPAISAIEALQADARHDSSQLGTAVRQVLNDFRGASLAAIVMFTDGVTTEGEDLIKASKYAAQVGVPLYFVGLGDAHEVRDVRLHDLQVEDSVYVNDRLVFELQLTGQGYDALNVAVTLREKGNAKALDVQQSVRVDANGKPVKIRLVHQPTEPGEKVYEIETPVQVDEVDKDNNKVERTVHVREAKLIKVLYVEGYRRYEFHYLKTLLERESDRTKGNKSIDLKVLLLEADPDFATQDRSALADFPTRAELNAFDVIILGDVDPRPRDNPKMAEHMKEIADFVKERGGGLLMIAGERFAPMAYKESPLKDVLPIDLSRDWAGEEADKPRVANYRPELTPVGRLHPIFRFSPDEKESDQIWAKLQPMYWWVDGIQPKRAAEVLAVHPHSRLPGALVAVSGGETGPTLADRQPLIVQQFAGAGRSLFFGFNETWRWGYREDQLRYNQFWIQTVRYLARSRLGRIDLRLDRQTPYRRGEPIKIMVRFPDDSPPPAAETEVKVVVERRASARSGDTEVRTLQLTKLEGMRATYEALLTRTPEGDYKFWLSQPAAGEPKPRAEARVLAPPGEMEKLRMNQADLEKAAEQSHGRFYTLADADHLLDDLPAGARVTINAPAPPLSLWNHPLLFLLALLFLTSEWLLRKRWNLL